MMQGQFFQNAEGYLKPLFCGLIGIGRRADRDLLATGLIVQAKGMRREVQRFSKAREGSVKYSTRWPWRMDSPCAASLAMPTSGAGSRLSVWSREGRMRGVRYSLFVRLQIG